MAEFEVLQEVQPDSQGLQAVELEELFVDGRSCQRDGLVSKAGGKRRTMLARGRPGMM